MNFDKKHDPENVNHFKNWSLLKKYKKNPFLIYSTKIVILCSLI